MNVLIPIFFFSLITVLTKNTRAFSILLLTQDKEIDTQGKSSTVEAAYRKMILYCKCWILWDVDLAYFKYTAMPHRDSSCRAILNFPHLSTFKWVSILDTLAEYTLQGEQQEYSPQCPI